jgi:hypothetical protein
MIDHPHDRPDDLVIASVELCGGSAIEVTAFHRELQPYLGFRRFGFGIGELADECRFIPALAPRFGQVGTD